MKLNTLNTQTENNELSFIQKNAGIKIMRDFPTGLSNISFHFENNVDTPMLSFEQFLETYNFIQPAEFDNLNTDNVWENSLLEVYKTYNFLVWKFNTAKEKLEKNWFEIDALLESVLKRLVCQLIEAGNGKRKLKNWEVVWLSSYSENHFVFNKVPYYAFASTNVSLDSVFVQNSHDGKEYSLREIDDILGSKNDTGGLFLPNSLWVSVSLITMDKNGNTIFISQERNNSATLSQNNAKYIASASWAVDYELFSWWGTLGLLHTSIDAEIQEELWINSVQSSLTQDWIINHTKLNIWWVVAQGDNYNKINIVWSLLHQEGFEILWRELWLEANLLPAALVMEDKRRNPEFIFLWKVWYTIENIRKSWEKAKSKDESLSIKWISYEEILEELENRKNWWEKKIDDHFFMSYIWFLLKSTIL